MRKKLLTTIACKMVLLAGVGTGMSVARAAEFGANTSYYEKDGLLDISEWFDGNNYNPTDEAWWRFDDETYQAAKDTGGDTDDDAWYGFTAPNTDDWYYDYYDPYSYGYYDYDNNNLYESGSQYYDYNDDGIYDAYAWYSDQDGDGLYDEFDYYSFTDQRSPAKKQQGSKATMAGSKAQTISGKVQKTKLVKVRGGKQHIVVAVQPDNAQSNQPLIVDLGQAEKLKDVNPKLGQTIKIQGPTATVGDQKVLMAKSVELNGQTKQIDRSARTISGKVLNVHTTKNRGQDHLLAMIEPTTGKKGKIAVDLGPADRLKVDVKKGTTITFSGVPVKVKDKVLIMAQSVEKNNQLVQINRQSRAVGGSRDQQQGTSTSNRR